MQKDISETFNYQSINEIISCAHSAPLWSANRNCRDRDDREERLNREQKEMKERAKEREER